MLQVKKVVNCMYLCEYYTKAIQYIIHIYVTVEKYDKTRLIKIVFDDKRILKLEINGVRSVCQ